MFKRTKQASIDGIDALNRREHTRLWYREQAPTEDPISPLEALAQGRPVSAVRITRTPRPAVGTDRLVHESISRSATLRKLLDDAADCEDAPEAPQVVTALTDWRDTPGHCPVLLLSASSLLDARNPGPILGPGTRYRVLSVHDGVAALEVEALDGNVGSGYCNSVDLTCFVPDIAILRREGGARGRHTNRLNLTRISQRISGVTAALVG